jgi:hypothetical protein
VVEGGEGCECGGGGGGDGLGPARTAGEGASVGGLLRFAREIEQRQKQILRGMRERKARARARARATATATATTKTGVLHCVQDDGERLATAEAKTEADPCGMTT